MRSVCRRQEQNENGKRSACPTIPDVHFVPAAVRAVRVISAFRRSRMPLTNAPDSFVENFLAMSTASLRLTTGGISSLQIVSYIVRPPKLRATAHKCDMYPLALRYS